jgi:hypothetical protein
MTVGSPVAAWEWRHAEWKRAATAIDVDAGKSMCRQLRPFADIAIRRIKMNRSRTSVAFAFCLSLATPIFGQEKGPSIQFPKASGPTVAPPGTVPYIPVVPAPPPQAKPPADIRPLPAIQYPTIVPFASIPPQPGNVELSPHAYTVPARIELSDGTTLAGEIHSDSPLQCTALFGPTAIPFNQMKGIEWRTGDDQERKATLILINGDTLTVSVTILEIQLKTTWGHATVELSQVRSIVMTIEKVKWSDTPDGRRVLVPAGDAPEGTPKE